MIEVAQGGDLREALSAIAGKDGIPSLERAGKMARKLRSRIIGGFSLEKIETGRTTRWCVRKRTAATEHP